ncbi:MAG: hypothetical protein R3D67_21495 [Hyphomicrobiaceae bacterium]
MSMRSAAAGFLGAASLGLAVWGVSAPVRSTGPDAVLASSFSRALADSDKSWQHVSPHLWLSSTAAPTPAGRALAVGDLITISGKGGRPVAVQVTSLQHVDGERIGMPAVSFQLVTARPAHDTSGAAMRFMFAVGQSANPTPLAPVPSDQLGRVL